MKRILFTGFFGMKYKHASFYINMWKKLNCEVDYIPYNILDVVVPKKYYNRITRISDSTKSDSTKYKEYDYAYCISGGCLYLQHLTFNKNININNIIFDSGPFNYSASHLEHFIHNTYNLHFLPLNNSILKYWKFKNIDIDIINNHYSDNILYKNIPKLILTSKKDTIINNIYINNYINSHKVNNITHIEFENGKHANLYKYNKKLYTDILYNYISK